MYKQAHLRERGEKCRVFLILPVLWPHVILYTAMLGYVQELPFTSSAFVEKGRRILHIKPGLSFKVTLWSIAPLTKRQCGTEGSCPTQTHNTLQLRSPTFPRTGWDNYCRVHLDDYRTADGHGRAPRNTSKLVLHGRTIP